MDQVAIITGGSRGIGAATSRLLAKQGYAVCINYHSRHQDAENLLAEIQHKGGKACVLAADVADEAQVIQLFDEVEAQLGPITHLVNNAGILLPQAKLIDMDAARINKILMTNVTSAFLCSREAIKRMQPGGAIVNVSSMAANLGSPNEYIDYAASKGAIDTLTKGLAVEVAALGIRVNAVRPGLIHTDIHADGGEPERVSRLAPKVPLQRGGEPEEVAEAIAWLLSDKASYSTGTFIDVSGGR